MHGLHKKSGQKLISERSKPYKNIAQLLKRSGLQNAEISTLAEIGAFREAYKRFTYCDKCHDELMKSVWNRVRETDEKGDDHVAPTAI